MYTDKEMLKMLKDYCDELGYTASKEEINSNKSIPSTSTYRFHFGGLYEAYELIDYAPNRIEGLTIKKFIKYIKRFYKKEKRIPNRAEFNKAKGYPHTDYLYANGYSWPQVIKMAGLEIYSRSSTFTKNRIAELIVKTLLEDNHEVIDLKEIKATAGSFLIDGKLIRVRYSHIYNYQHNGSKREEWKFSVRGTTTRTGNKVDYFILVGLDEDEEFAERFFVLKGSTVSDIKKVSIGIHSTRSKYLQYEVSEQELMHYVF